MTLAAAHAWLIAREKHPKRMESPPVTGVICWRWLASDSWRGTDGCHELPPDVFRYLPFPRLYMTHDKGMDAAARAAVAAEAMGRTPPRDAISLDVEQ